MKNGFTPGKTDGANRKRNKTATNAAHGRAKNGDHAGANSEDYLANAKQRNGWKTKRPQVERPHWKAPALLTTPIPAPVCPICEKSIKDLSDAITDKSSGFAAHFECVLSRVAGAEHLEEGDKVVYIGGGRFGVINFQNDSASNAAAKERCFTIKRIIDFEESEEHSAWRSDIADHYSLT